jgi:sec-independent protein translocase protein TatC
VVKKKQKSKGQEAMIVRDHIRELQRRLLVVFALLVAAGVVSFFFYHQIIDILRAPLNQQLYYTTPVGSFAFIMRICLIGGMVVAIPAIVYNLLMFVRPAFKKPMSRGLILLITLFSLGLAGLGVLFSYFVIIPGALRFFGGFSVDGLSALIQADSYLNFVINALIIFMLMFQLPLIITLIDHMKRLTMKKLFKAERWVILGSLVAALMVPFAMDLSVSLLISLPIILLYNLSILIVAIRHAMTKKPTLAKKTPSAVVKNPVEPAKQPVVLNSIQANPIKATQIVSHTKPKPVVAAQKKTLPAEPHSPHRAMDISSYPINGSVVIPNSTVISEQTKPATPKPNTLDLCPTLRTVPRSASRLIVPQRNQTATDFGFAQTAEFDPETP